MGGTAPVEGKNLADARDRLIERMAEYKAHTGWRVIVVFDAHWCRELKKEKSVMMLKFSLRGKMKRPMKELKNLSLN